MNYNIDQNWLFSKQFKAATVTLLLAASLLLAVGAPIAPSASAAVTGTLTLSNSASGTLWGNQTLQITVSDSDINVNDYLIFEVFRRINPSEFTQAYNDFWLKRYATALIKKQWGENLIKFQGVTMLGGVTMNGETIYNEAKEEIATLEEQGRLTFETPVNFDIG